MKIGPRTRARTVKEKLFVSNLLFFYLGRSFVRRKRTAFAVQHCSSRTMLQRLMSAAERRGRREIHSKNQQRSDFLLDFDAFTRNMDPQMIMSQRPCSTILQPENPNKVIQSWPLEMIMIRPTPPTVGMWIPHRKTKCVHLNQCNVEFSSRPGSEPPNGSGPKLQVSSTRACATQNFLGFC